MKARKQMTNNTSALSRHVVCTFLVSMFVACMVAAAPTYAYAEAVVDAHATNASQSEVGDATEHDGVVDTGDTANSADGTLSGNQVAIDEATTNDAAIEDIAGSTDSDAGGSLDTEGGQEANMADGAQEPVGTEADSGIVEVDNTTETQLEEEVTGEASAGGSVDVAVTEPTTETAIEATAPTTATTTATTAAVVAKPKAKAKTAPAYIKAGWYSLKTALNTAFYIHVKGSKSKDGTPVILKKWSDANGQAFRLKKVGNYYRIVCGTGYKSRIHVAADGKVTLARTGSHNTLFTLIQEGDKKYRLVNLATGMALAVANNKAGSGISIVAQKSIVGSASQTFVFEMRSGLIRDGIYSIRTVLTGKRALSPYKGKLKKKTNSALTDYKGKLYQKWQIKAVAGKMNTYTIENIATGYRLTGGSGTPAKINKASNSKKQWWKPFGLNGKVLFKNAKTGKVLQLYDGAYTSGTITTCVKQSNEKKQQWTLKRVQPVGTGVYELDLAANKGLALEIPGSSFKQNAQAKVFNDKNTANQRWYYDASSKTLTNVNSGKVLTVKGSAVAGANAVQADVKDSNAQKWEFIYLGEGKFRLTSAANSSLALNATGTTASSAVNVATNSGSNTQAWRVRQTKSDVTTYIELGFSLEQMARWQKAGNPYLSGYTMSYIKSVLNPANGSKYKFLDLRKSTGVSASVLDKFINRYGSKGKLKGLGQAFVDACKTYNIDQSYLLAHAILESDWGRSALATGYKYSGGYIDGKYYKKGTYYNFFGIGAYDSSPLSGGRKLAIINGWNTPAKAVKGAAKWIAGNYIYATNHDAADRYPQNTLYSMKWDLARTKATKKYGWHQYATSTTWADSIGNLIGQILSAAGNKASLTYIIPKYK